MKEDLYKKAIAVLDANFQDGGFTIPSAGLYPFQWKWDSGFIAIGFAHYDVEKAKTEMRTLLDAQWKNGHILFFIQKTILIFLEQIFISQNYTHYLLKNIDLRV